MITASGTGPSVPCPPNGRPVAVRHDHRHNGDDDWRDTAGGGDRRFVDFPSRDGAFQ